MSIKPITDFLADRKAKLLKKKIKKTMSEQEQLQIQAEADNRFSLGVWLPDAARRAKQLSLVTHPSKFSHPGASRDCSMIATTDVISNGFLCGSSTNTKHDVLGNAAAIDVYKFLSIILEDEQTILEHLEQGTDLIRGAFKIPTASFEELQQGFLAIKQLSLKTSSKIKQVYFPVGDDNYHLLSLLTPSGVMFSLSEKIRKMFSLSEKIRKKQEHSEQGFKELYDLTVIGFGGEKPQNISVLNNDNAGVAYLLPSLPPQLQQKNVLVPKTDFFKNSLYWKDHFNTFHRLIATGYNNINIREDRDKVVNFIISQVIERMWAIRQLEAGWSQNQLYQQLPLAQKIWLDNFYHKQREEDEQWLTDIIDEFARWFMYAYKKNVKDSKLFGDEEFQHIKTLIQANQEGLK